MSQRTKKLLCLLTAVACVTVMAAGCNNNTKTDTPSSSSTTTTEASTTTTKVDIIVPADGKVDAVVNVKDHGAVGDGVADDTAAFREALSEAKSQKLPVYLPDGTYRLTSAIMLTSQTIIGYDVEKWPEDASKLPTVLIDHQEQPGFALTGAAISGVNITFKDINADGPAINLIGTGSRIHNMKITNAPQGIVFSEEGMLNPGRSNVENVIMEGIDELGLYVSGTLDVPYVGNVTISGTSKNFTQNGRAFVLAQNDDIRMINCTAIGANIGYQFTDLETTMSGANSSRGTWGSLIDCEAKNVNIGVDVISNLPELIMPPLTLNRMNLDAKINAVRVNTSRMQMCVTSSTLKSASGAAIQIDGGDGLVFSGCQIQAGGSADGVRIKTTKNLTISTCTIKAGGRGVVADKFKPAAVLICDNTIKAGGSAIVDNMPSNANKLFKNNK